MSKKEIKKTEEGINCASHCHSKCSHRVLIVFSVITLLLVGLIFYKVTFENQLVRDQIYGESQKALAKLDVLSGSLDALANKVEVLSMTAPSAVGGGNINVKDLAVVEKLNVKANKYHVIFLTKEIVEKINTTEDFSDKFDELKSLLGGKFANEMAEIEKYKNMNILNHDEMVKIVEDSTKATKPTTEEEQSAFDNIKSLFKVTSSDEDLKVKCNPIIIDSAIKNLREKNEWEALKTLEQVEPKNDGLKKVVENLNLRNVLKYYVNLISDETLKNG
jgi:hypothetical protein